MSLGPAVGLRGRHGRNGLGLPRRRDELRRRGRADGLRRSWRLKAAGTVGGADPNNTFKAGSSYAIDVKAADLSVTFQSEVGPITVRWDCSEGDELTPPAAANDVFLTMVEPDKSAAGINYHGAMKTLIGASYSLKGGLPNYPFAP
jgi:hypothetical protein